MTGFKKNALDHGGPYTAQPSGGHNDWWFVADKLGFNCLVCTQKPGAVFTSQESAIALAQCWNTAE